MNSPSINTRGALARFPVRAGRCAAVSAIAMIVCFGGAAAHAQKLLITCNDFVNGIVQEYDLASGALTTIVPFGSGGATIPNGLEIDPVDGSFYVGVEEDAIIQKYDADGVLLGSYGAAPVLPPGSLHPKGLALHPNRQQLYTAYWLSTPTSDCVLRLNLATGGVAGTICRGDNSESWGLAFRPNGNLVVAYNSGAHHDVVEYNASGVAVRTYSHSLLTSPRDVTFAPNGDVVVANYGNGMILRFRSSDGGLVDSVTGASWVSGVTFGPDGHLYAALSPAIGAGSLRRYNGATLDFMATLVTGPTFPQKIKFRPQERGACCWPSGSCSDGLTEAQCVGSGGTYAGDDTVCASIPPCPPPAGACCLPTGVCVDGVTAADCAALLGGVYQGDFTTCATIPPCPPPTGACCLPVGLCLDGFTAADCAALLGGVYQGDFTTCATIPPCPPPTGACCVPGGLCVDGVAAADCAGFPFFGVYLGDLSTCATSPACGACPLPGGGGAFCSADVDGDCDVDLTDLATTLAAFGSTVGSPGYDPDADQDGDGDVDLSDLALVLAQFGDDCA